MNMPNSKLPIWQKALYILSWILFMPIHLLLMLIGLIVVPLALLFKADMQNLPLYGNREEACPLWWVRMAKKKGGFIAKFYRFWWFAIRNPVNNFRYLFDDREAYVSGNWHMEVMEAYEMMMASRIRTYRWAYNGAFAGYRCVWLEPPYVLGIPMAEMYYGEFWIGWKVGSKVPGMGFTLQYRRHRRVGR
jgi:hypothetical protein